MDGIWIIGPDARTVYANDQMLAIPGAEAVDVVGQPSFGFVFPDNVPAAEQLFAAKIRCNAAGEFTGIVGTFTALELG